MKSVFPIGIALGEAFCNRVAERQLLANNINNIRHTVLIGPRRYGKTSLVMQVLQETGYQHCSMDFLLCGNTSSVQAKLLHKVGQALHALLPKSKQVKQKILALFAKFKPELSLSYHDVELGVRLSAPEIAGIDLGLVCELLLKLDQAAQLANKQLVMFMDEFQQIALLADGAELEAAIRHAVERAENITYIFSGSNRHMLQEMFSDRARPFYRLCHIMPIARIAAAEYERFIQQHAQQKWHKSIDADSLQAILSCSELHPYYVNLICNHFWTNDLLPSLAAVEEFWQRYVQTERSFIASDISGLSNNQKLVLQYFANHPTTTPIAKEVYNALRLSPASLKQAVDKLLAKDIIYVDSDGVTRLLDPAMGYYIVNQG